MLFLFQLLIEFLLLLDLLLLGLATLLFFSDGLISGMGDFGPVVALVAHGLLEDTSE